MSSTGIELNASMMNHPVVRAQGNRILTSGMLAVLRSREMEGAGRSAPLNGVGCSAGLSSLHHYHDYYSASSTSSTSTSTSTSITSSCCCCCCCSNCTFHVVESYMRSVVQPPVVLKLRGVERREYI